jgi:hypothetical protein
MDRTDPTDAAVEVIVEAAVGDAHPVLVLLALCAGHVRFVIEEAGRLAGPLGNPVEAVESAIQHSVQDWLQFGDSFPVPVAKLHELEATADFFIDHA